jgi:TolB-like protein/Flp pilus assembly protein TadD
LPPMSEVSGIQRFFAELKRRKVFRIAAVYGAVAFVVLQVADILVPALRLPETFTTGIALLSILGFPIAVVLAWAFESTPEGILKTDAAATGEIEAIVAQPAASRWPSGLLALAGILALAIGGWMALSNRPATTVVDTDARSASATEADADTVHSGRPPSLAVLPFDNMSRDPETLPFTDGLHDDLLTQLSKIGSLKVISRTSVQEYRDSPKSIPEIGRELDVGYVLEGGVQRAGDQFRLNVQLIDAESEGHVWAEQYTGELTVAGIFAIQTEIATKIADALQAQLTADQRENLARVPTQDLEAYEAYRRGMEYIREGYAEPTIRTADRFADQAIARDSTLAEAWALKSVAASSLYWFFYDRSDSITTASLAHARRALELAPDLSYGHWALGAWPYRVMLAYDRALEEIDRALEGMPGEVDLHTLAGSVHRRNGEMEEAIVRYRDAAGLDPRQAMAPYSVGETLSLLRRYGEAEPWFRRAIAIRPDFAFPYSFMASNRVRAEGDTAGARKILEDMLQLGIYDQGLENGAFADLYRQERDGASMRSEVGSEPVYRNSQFFFEPGSFLTAWSWRIEGNEPRASAAFDSARVIVEARLVDDPDDARFHSVLGVVLAGLGRDEEAIASAKKGLELMPPEVEAWRGTYRLRDLALVYAMTGRPDEALDLLERLLSMPSDLSVWDLRLDPYWDGLRGDPRFEALAAGAS